jgi:outer membrane protein
MQSASAAVQNRPAQNAVPQITIAIALSLAGLIALPAAAQEQAGNRSIAPAPSSVYLSIGVAALSSPRPYVGATNTTTPLPVVELYYRNLYVQGTRAGFDLLRHGDLAFGVRGRLVLAGLDPASSPYLAGMEERRWSIEGGIGLDWTPGDYELSATAYTDLLGRSNGQQVGLDLSRSWTFDGMRYGISPSVGAVWQSADFVNYYAGVWPDEARPDRRAYRGEAAVNSHASVTGYMFLTRRIQLVGQVNVQRLDTEILASPVVDRRHAISGFVGVAYRFK